jgi:diguanylate cyclase (GGDEF)-like protein
MAAALIALLPGTESCPARMPWIEAVPYLLCMLAAGMGVAFRQGRVALLSVVMLAAAAKYLRAGSGAVLTVTLIVLPCAATLLFSLRERGLLSIHGLPRILLAAALASAVWCLPEIDPFVSWLAKWFPCTVSGGCASCPGLGLGFLALAASLAVLARFRPAESPVLGPLLFSAATMMPLGMALGGVSGPARDRGAALLAFSAAGAALCWAVMDAAWRHAHLDELTGLPARRSLRHALGDLVGDYTVAVVDIDFFKKVNDRYGHDVGDQVLRYVASVLRECRGVRAFRYGGEEFVLVFNRGAFEEHLSFLEDLRGSIERKTFTVRSRLRPFRKANWSEAGAAPARQGTLALTISIGAARAGGEHADAESVIRAADNALYRAKRSGRNRVCQAN